jgi:glycerophosphoryl diester phosphodiesterase
MELVADYDRPVELAIETKHPTRYAGLVERRLVEQLHEFGWDRAGGPVRVMSFSWKALQRVERLAPAVPVVQLIEHAHHWPVLSRIVAPHWMVGADVRLLEDLPRLGPRITAAGHELHAFTVNDEPDLDLCLRLGVAAIITDRPGWARDQLTRRAEQDGGEDPSTAGSSAGRAAQRRPRRGARRGARREDAAG